MLHESSGKELRPSNSAAAASCSENPPDKIIARSCGEGWFGAMVQGLWRSKPAAMLQYLAGMPERTSYAYSSGDREPAASVLASLLRSDEGFRVLDWVMDGSPAPWWRDVRRARIVCDAFDSARNRIEQLQLDL